MMTKEQKIEAAAKKLHSLTTLGLPACRRIAVAVLEAADAITPLTTAELEALKR